MGIIIALGGSTGKEYKHGFQSKIDHGHQQVPLWQPNQWTSAWLQRQHNPNLQLVTQAMDTSMNPCCNGTNLASISTFSVAFKQPSRMPQEQESICTVRLKQGKAV